MSGIINKRTVIFKPFFCIEIEINTCMDTTLPKMSIKSTFIIVFFKEFTEFPKIISQFFWRMQNPPSLAKYPFHLEYAL